MKDKELYKFLDAYAVPSGADRVSARVREKIFGTPFFLFVVRQVREASIPLACCLVFGVFVGVFSGMMTGTASAEAFVDELVVKETFYE